MKLKAIIFDFFGTLVDNFSSREHERTLSEMAKVLSASQHDFVRMWVETFPARATGVFPTIEANIEYICRAIDCHVTHDQIRAALRIRSRFYRQALTPRHGALTILFRLRLENYKIGLITDCSCELPNVWSSTRFAPLIDVAVFSCQVGVRKPDPGIYRFAYTRLGVAPGDCLYVGDGNSKELTGALAVGMQSLLIRVPYEETEDVYNMDREEWTGPFVSDLTDILSFVKAAEKTKRCSKQHSRTQPRCRTRDHRRPFQSCRFSTSIRVLF
jgi:putative hydrolase of the HAD superfamily